VRKMGSNRQVRLGRALRARIGAARPPTDSAVGRSRIFKEHSLGWLPFLLLGRVRCTAIATIDCGPPERLLCAVLAADKQTEPAEPFGRCLGNRA